MQAKHLKELVLCQPFHHRCACSDPGAPTEGVTAILLDDPFSTGGGTPHLFSDSRGSKT